MRPYYTGVLAGMCGTAGRFDDGLRFVNKAIAVASSQDSQWCLAELHRIKGELMLAHGELTTAVEPCFETAIAIAREQSAKSWELRATVSHARLLHSQGRSAEGKKLLAPVYGWFTEGFDIPDRLNAHLESGHPRSSCPPGGASGTVIHSMTSSARGGGVRGVVKPSALAVFRLKS